MVSSVDISLGPWPLSWIRRLRTMEPYNRSLGAVQVAATRYADALSEEVAIATGRSPRRGRALMLLGHVLGWGGLALSLVGIAMLRRADLDQLLFGPFGIGLLMQIPSGALVRAGRRELRPTEAELQAVDRRRPVVLLRAGRSDDDVTFLNDELRPALLSYGPLVDSSRTGSAGTAFGEADRRASLVPDMDRSVLLVLAPSSTGEDGGDIAWAADIIARRRYWQKTLILMPSAPGSPKSDERIAGQRERWTVLRAALAGIPGFAAMPETAPARLIAMHLASDGSLILMTGPALPGAADYHRAVDAAIYGMKCHGKS